MLDSFHKSLKNNKLPPPPPPKIRSRVSASDSVQKMRWRCAVSLVFALLVGAENLYAQTTPALVLPRRIGGLNEPSDTPSIITSSIITSRTYTVALETQPTGEVTVAVASNDITIATVSPSSLTFTTTNWSTGQTVTVTAVDDDVDNGYQRQTRVTHIPRGGGYDGVTSRPIFVNVLNDDTKGIRVRNVNLAVLESGTMDNEVWLDSEPTGNVKIRLTSQDPTRVTISDEDTLLTFTPSNWDTKQTVTLSGVDDTVSNTGQPQRQATINLRGRGADYEGLTNTMTVDVVDDEPISLGTLDEGSQTTYSVTVLMHVGWSDIVLNPTSSDPDKVKVTPTELTWTLDRSRQGQTIAYSNRGQTITVEVLEGSDSDDESVTISHPLGISTPPRWIPIQDHYVILGRRSSVGAPVVTDPDTDLPSTEPGAADGDSDAADPDPNTGAPFENLLPAFADTAMIGDLVFEVNQAIEPLTLPQAIGGDMAR